MHSFQLLWTKILQDRAEDISENISATHLNTYVKQKKLLVLNKIAKRYVLFLELWQQQLPAVNWTVTLPAAAALYTLYTVYTFFKPPDWLKCVLSVQTLDFRHASTLV